MVDKAKLLGEDLLLVVRSEFEKALAAHNAGHGASYGMPPGAMGMGGPPGGGYGGGFGGPQQPYPQQQQGGYYGYQQQPPQPQGDAPPASARRRGASSAPARRRLGTSASSGRFVRSSSGGCGRSGRADGRRTDRTRDGRAEGLPRVLGRVRLPLRPLFLLVSLDIFPTSEDACAHISSIFS